MTTVEVPRDRWGRPLIVPPDGGEPVPYARPSSLGKLLEDDTQLTKWKLRKVVEGLARRPELVTSAVGALAGGDPDTDWPTKRTLNGIASGAMEAASSGRGAVTGTALHSMTDALDEGRPDAVWPLLTNDPGTRARLEAYQAATAKLEPVQIEGFVVCDAIRAAGTFDRLWRLPDGRVVVGDLKTGKSEADYPLPAAVQMAVYANAATYHPDAGRYRLPADLCTTVGLLVHMPPSGGCRVIPLNLTLGWFVAQIAAHVYHDVRKIQPTDVILPAVT